MPRIEVARSPPRIDARGFPRFIDDPRPRGIRVASSFHLPTRSIGHVRGTRHWKYRSIPGISAALNAALSIPRCSFSRILIRGPRILVSKFLRGNGITVNDTLCECVPAPRVFDSVSCGELNELNPKQLRPSDGPLPAQPLETKETAASNRDWIWTRFAARSERTIDPLWPLRARNVTSCLS